MPMNQAIRRRAAITHLLRNNHYCILVCSPENFKHSNGIRILLETASLLQSLGLDITVVPGDSFENTYTCLAPPYENLSIAWDVPDGCSALVGDTISSERLQEVRARAARICHYTLAPNGLFGAEGRWANRIILEPGEQQAVYSPQVSTILPTFYHQAYFPELESWINRNPRALRPYPTSSRSSHFRACIYAGKGHLKKVPYELSLRLYRRGSTLITRHNPTTKNELYRLISGSDLVICYDPISSLAHEAILLGVPVFIPVEWDESDFKAAFPVRLDGIVWNDIAEFLRVLQFGFDHQAVIETYRSALAANTSTMLDLLQFAFSDAPEPAAAARINTYWESRQAFFIGLRLPSLTDRLSLKQALPAHTPLEYIQDLRETTTDLIGDLCSRIRSLLRTLRRRFAFSRHQGSS